LKTSPRARAAQLLAVAIHPLDRRGAGIEPIEGDDARADKLQNIRAVAAFDDVANAFGAGNLESIVTAIAV
jgi:hypothetical protein